MTEIPRWKVDAALRLLGIDDAEGIVHSVQIGPKFVRVAFGAGVDRVLGITDAAEDTRLHLLAMLPGENWSELVAVGSDELKYFTGPKLVPGSLVKYPNGTMMLTVKRRP